MKEICIVCALAFAPTPALAATIYTGNDAGAGPSSPRPNTDSAAAAFDSAAAILGPVSLITFESLPIGQFGSTVVAPGVTVTQTNYDTSLCGIVVNGYTTPTGAPTGYNITPAGTKFLGFVPRSGATTASLNFAFSTPVQAWGAYIVGLDPTVAGSVAVQFVDGTADSYPLTETSPAGPQFFGFTAAGGSISQITLIETGLTTLRDIYGVDDVRFVVAVPEPSAIVCAVGAFAILSVGRRRLFRCNRDVGRRAKADGCRCGAQGSPLMKLNRDKITFASVIVSLLASAVLTHAAQAAETSTIFDNIQTAEVGLTASATGWSALSFITSASPMALDSVDVRLLPHSNTGVGEFVVRLFSDGPLEQPYTQRETLSGPSTPDFGTYHYTSTGHSTLDPNSLYWIVFSGTGTEHDYSVGAELPGRGIAFGSTRGGKFSANAGAGWTGSNWIINMRVTGAEVVPEPAAPTLLFAIALVLCLSRPPGGNFRRRS